MTARAREPDEPERDLTPSEAAKLETAMGVLRARRALLGEAHAGIPVPPNGRASYAEFLFGPRGGRLWREALRMRVLVEYTHRKGSRVL